MIFDKTGTLTMGQPQVVKVWQGRRRREESLTSNNEELEKSETPHIVSYEALAGALARHSTHPISQAVAKLSAEDIKISDWQEVRGAGVQADIQHPQRPTLNIQVAWRASARCRGCEKRMWT